MLPAGFNLHDKEMAEDTATGILIHYHAIAALLENGIGMAECALSNDVWLCLHNNIFVRVIHGIVRSFSDDSDADLCATTTTSPLSWTVSGFDISEL